MESGVSKTLKEPTVLIIDDDPLIVDFLTEVLEDEGYRVLTSVDGAALRMARETRPDVILLDVMMPAMDGLEVSRRLREDPTTRNIPIVVMSAHDRLNTVAATMQVNDKLSKPFHFGDLSATVARWAKVA